MIKQLNTAMAAALVLTALAVQAQTTATGTTDASAQAPHKTRTKKVKQHVETEQERAIRELQEKLAAQQAQIDALRQQNSASDAAAATAQQTAATAQSAAATAQSQAAAASAAAQQQADQVSGLKSSITDVQSKNASLADSIDAAKKDMAAKIDTPTTIHYKGVTFTPVAFFAFEGVWRQHSVNSDINTPFNAIPFPGASEGHTSELNFSGRQSRLGLLAEGNAGPWKLSGYVETDFLGTGVTSNNNQSNSYVLRQRQFWGKGETASGFAVTGGQMWSLVTEDRRGTDARTEIQPQTIDPQYLVGYSWTRQPTIRLQQRFGDYKTGAFTLALSAEQAQITGFTAAGNIPNQFFFGGIGQPGGLYNAAAGTGAPATITTYANNVAPDFIVKAAFDGPAYHVEFGGLARFLRDEYFPVTTTSSSSTPGTPVYNYGTTYTSHTSPAGGVFGSARVYLGKLAEVALQGMAGQGVGRYGSSQLADATLKPDETLEPIRNYHGMFTLETHPTSKLDVFAYYGGEYAQRTVYATAAGNLIGYGPQNLADGGCYNLPAAPATNVGPGNGGGLGAPNCTSPTRYIQEPMAGFIYRVVSSPKYGRLQYWVTYSYLQRNLWSGVGSATTPSGPRATEPMVHISMRYYIP